MYPCIAVEHSYNCMVLLCSLFFWPSGHYTNKAPNSDFTVGENYIFFKGIKICWGNARLEVTKGANNSATQTISFPITFFEVRVYHSQTADTYDGSIKGMVIRGNSNSFIMQGRVWQDTAQNPVYAYNWVAIGR